MERNEKRSNSAQAIAHVHSFLEEHAALVKKATVGLVLAIGSSGLLLGGVTVALSSFFVLLGMDLLSAMTLGFFATGAVGVLLGSALLFTTARAFKNHYLS